MKIKAVFRISEGMRAILCQTLDGFESLCLEDVPPPVMADMAGVRIRVHAGGINFADTLICKGQYQTRPELPFSPGLEVAGEVIDVADTVTNVSVGQRVMALLSYGGYAQEVIASSEMVYPIPDSMSWEIAAGFPIVYGTSYVALVERARLKANEILLVHGAAGGVGLSAVEVGKRLGARVIATAGGPDKLAVARQSGADHLIDYHTEDVRERVLAITEGRGVDVVFDPVGGDVFDASLRCTVSGGRLLLVGFASGKVPQIPANIMLVKNVDVMGIFFGAMRKANPEMVQRAFGEMIEWVKTGDLRPHVSQIFALKDARDALRMLVERRSTGKVVLSI